MCRVHKWSAPCLAASSSSQQLVYRCALKQLSIISVCLNIKQLKQHEHHVNRSSPTSCTDARQSLQLFNILAIIGLIPVYDRVFVPLLSRFGKKMTLLQRIGRRLADQLLAVGCLHHAGSC